MCGLPVTKGDMWKVGSFSVSSTSTTDDCRQHNHHQRELTVICCHQRLLRSHTEKQGKGWMTPCMHDAIDWEQREQHIAGIDESSELLLLLQASHVIHGRGGEVCVCVGGGGGGGGGGGYRGWRHYCTFRLGGDKGIVAAARNTPAKNATLVEHIYQPGCKVGTPHSRPQQQPQHYYTLGRGSMSHQL